MDDILCTEQVRGCFHFGGYMRLIILSEVFYEKYGSVPEILTKADRPYYCVTITVYNHTFAIPLRHHIRHPFCFKTLGEAGLDFSKAVVVDDPAYISNDSPWIDSAEWAILKRSENVIYNSFKQYVARYRRALKHPDEPRNQLILRYGTLGIFLSE